MAGSLTELAGLGPAEIARRLGAYRPERWREPYPDGFFDRPPTPAAVLVPLILGAAGPEVLFIRRACHPADRHSGQVAFPGGRIDAGDADACAAALREAHEEVGLSPDDVTVLGALPEYRSVSNFVVRPWVGAVAPPFVPRPDAREVERVFTIPLAWLLDTRNFEVREHDLHDWGCRLPVVHFHDHDGEHLWGVSARIVLSLRAALLGGDAG
ncbi:MAG: CoA pyrophosphatase [Chromatiales bacterium]|nr:CoA pyrophosphatase [Chromatiales bacterium]